MSHARRISRIDLLKLALAVTLMVGFGTGVLQPAVQVVVDWAWPCVWALTQWVGSFLAPMLIP